MLSDINFTTTRIEMVQQRAIVGSATGFFFRHNGAKYLATNRHVILDESEGHRPDTLQLTLHQSRNALTANRTVEVSLYVEGRRLWLEHPNYLTNHCDIALIPLSAVTLVGDNFRAFSSSTIFFIGSELINKMEINPFGDLVVLGYPLGFHDELHNLPVYRKAMIASSYGIDFSGLPYFLVDANLHAGTSGSPVLNTPHTLFSDQGGKEGYVLFGVHSAEHLVDGDPLGLNVVWYARLLAEIADETTNG